MTKQLQPETVSTPIAARSEAVEQINKIFARLKARTAGIEDEMIAVGNEAIQLGLYFELATGKSQLEPYMYNGLEGLDEQLSFKFAQRCVNLKNRKGKDFKFTSIAEVQTEFNPLLEGLEMIEPSSRQKTLGAPLVKDWGVWMIKTFHDVNSGIQELLKEAPMEQWSDERLENFTALTKHAHDQHEKAEGLRGRK